MQPRQQTIIRKTKHDFASIISLFFSCEHSNNIWNRRKEKRWMFHFQLMLESFSVLDRKPCKCCSFDVDSGKKYRNTKTKCSIFVKVKTLIPKLRLDYKNLSLYFHILKAHLEIILRTCPSDQIFDFFVFHSILKTLNVRFLCGDTTWLVLYIISIVTLKFCYSEMINFNWVEF